MVAIRAMDITGSSDRLDVSVSDVTKTGFNLNYRTWYDSKLNSVAVDWIAAS